jgi:hypothetical protein
MVARIDNEVLTPALFTPRPELSDSDDVLLALETARALETQGEVREAVRWLRRAADEAEMQGNDERVLALARAAADLSNTLVSSPAEAPTIPPPSISPYPPTTPPPDSFEATIPPAASMAAPATISAVSELSASAEMPPVERSMRIGAIRVAIGEGSIRGVKSFSVERLDRGQLAPPGTTEAMLVFSGEIDGTAEYETDPGAGGSSTA